MSIVFAGIAPHSPLLLPHLGKEKTLDLQQTTEALFELEKALYLSYPDIIVLISDHNRLYKEIFTVLGNENFVTSLEKLGDIKTKEEFKGSPVFAGSVATALRKDGYKIHNNSQEKLDYGSSIPLLFLSKHLKNIPIVPIGPAEKDSKELFEVGVSLRELFLEQKKRIAILALGNGSHCLSEGSPAGYHADGKVFDDTLKTHLENRNSMGVLQMGDALVKNAKQSLYNPTCMLLGILKNTQTNFQNLSYEHPFGIGYLVGNFEI